jgi:hypothetical protein
MEDLAVTILADGLQVIPGNQVAFKVEVRNLGTVVDRYFCDVLGLDPAWSTVTPASLELLPDMGRLPGQIGHGAGPTVGTFTVSLHPPRHHSALARTWPLAVNVRSENDARIHRIEETSLAILPFGQIGAQLTPSASRSRLSTTPTLRLENLGNQTELVTYEGTDTAGRLEFEFSPPKRELKPGQVAPVKVRLSPSGSNIIGQAQTSSYSIQVRGSGMGTSPVALSGSHAQLSIIPTQLPWFAAVVIALGMAGLALRAMVATPDTPPAASEAPQGGGSSPGPTVAPTVVQPSAVASPTSSPTATPQASTPTSPTPTPTSVPPTPTPSPTPTPAVAAWALAKAQDLATLEKRPWTPVGVTRRTSDGQGRVQRFDHGLVYRTNTGAIVGLRGWIGENWLSRDGDPGPVTKLGYPLADEELDAAQMPFQRFQNGVLQCTPAVCQFFIPNQIYTLWSVYRQSLGNPAKEGGPISSGPALGTTFEKGIVYFDPRNNFHAVCTLTGQVIHATSPISDCTVYATLVKAMP